MNRSLTATLLAATVLIVGVAMARSPVQRNEIEDMPIPTLNPVVITPNVPTFVTITSALADYPTIRGPRLEVWDTERNRWRNIGRLYDRGRGRGRDGDEAADDGVFSLRIRLLDVGGTVEIAIVRGETLRIRSHSSIPLQLRLTARQRGVGRISSPSVFLDSIAPATVIVRDSVTGSSVEVMVPPMVDEISTGASGTLLLRKSTLDGYQMHVRVRPNPDHWELQRWIIACVFGPCSELPGPEEPQTLAEYPREMNEQPIEVQELQGYQLRLNDLGGATLLIALDDPTNARVIEFTAYPDDSSQSNFFADNLPEISAIVNSLAP